MSVTKKILDDAVRGIPESGGQRRNVVGQFHGPKTSVPVLDPAKVPGLDCLDFVDDEGYLLGGIDAPSPASADDGKGDSKLVNRTPYCGGVRVPQSMFGSGSLT